MKYLISPAFFMAGIAGILDQEIRCGASWNWGHMLGLHHEPLIAGCFVVGIALIIGSRK